MNTKPDPIPTWQEIRDVLGCCQSAAQKKRNGARRVTPQEAVKLADKLKLDLGALVRAFARVRLEWSVKQERKHAPADLPCPHCRHPLHPAHPCGDCGHEESDPCWCSDTAHPGWAWTETGPDGDPVECPECGVRSVIRVDDDRAWASEVDDV